MLLHAYAAGCWLLLLLLLERLILFSVRSSHLQQPKPAGADRPKAVVALAIPAAGWQ